MRVFDVRHHPHPLGYPCAKFRFCRALHCWASPWRKIAYSINQSLNQSITDSLTHPAYLMRWKPKLSLRNIIQNISLTFIRALTHAYTANNFISVQSHAMHRTDCTKKTSLAVTASLSTLLLLLLLLQLMVLLVLLPERDVFCVHPLRWLQCYVELRSICVSTLVCHTNDAASIVWYHKVLVCTYWRRICNSPLAVNQWCLQNKNNKQVNSS